MRKVLLFSPLFFLLLLACQSLDKLLAGPSQGTLLAAPGMTFDEVRKSTNFALDSVYHGGSQDYLTLSNAIAFEFQLAGTGLKFERCRFYSLQTMNPDPKIYYIQIQVEKNVTWKEAKAALNQTREKLKKEGWTPESFPDGVDENTPAPPRDLAFTWTKGDLSFTYSARRFPQTITGEDPNQGSNYEQDLEIKRK